jgi:hypothetical protein
MQCDLRFVAGGTKPAFAFVRRGIIPELGSHSILPRVIAAVPDDFCDEPALIAPPQRIRDRY